MSYAGQDVKQTSNFPVILSRRAFAALGVGLTVLHWVGRTAVAANDESTLSLSLDWLPLGNHAPFYLAAEKGWFKRAGIEVSITQGSGSNTTVQTVNAGQFDVGYAELASMAFGRNRGMPLVAIAEFFRKGDMALIVPVGSPIKTPADLKGKKLIATAGSFEGPFLDAFLAKGKLSRNEVELMNISTSTRTQLYIDGKVDGVFASPIGTLVQVEKSRPSRPILFADFGLNIPSFGLFATAAMLKRKGPALRAFASVVSGAWTYIAVGHHEEEGIQAVLKARPQDRLDPNILRKQLADSLPFLYSPSTANMPIGIQSEVDWADAIRLMEQAKVLTPGSKASDYFTNDYLDASLIKKIGEGWPGG